MKAKEWVAKLAEDGSNLDEILTEYALETRELADTRTKKSDDKTKASVYDGVVREQRQKWQAICNQKPNLLNVNMFDKMLVTDLNDVATSVHNYKNPPQTKKNEEDKSVVGRKLSRNTTNTSLSVSSKS